MGTTGPCPSTASSTLSCERTTSSSQSMSLRLRRSPSSPYSSSGTALTTAASPAARTTRGAWPAATPATSGGTSGSSPPATQYTHSPDPASGVRPGCGAGGRRASASSTSSRSKRPRSRAFTAARASARASRIRSSTSPIARLLEGRGGLEALEPFAQVAVLAFELLPRLARQRRVALPPVDAHLLRLVDRRHEQSQLDRQELDVEQVDLDVACDHDALVEHPLEDVGEVARRRRLGRRARAVRL